MPFHVLPHLLPSHERCHGLHPGSELYMSGFYVDDIAVIREEAGKNGLAFLLKGRPDLLTATIKGISAFIRIPHKKEQK